MNKQEFLDSFLADVEAIRSQNDIPWLAALRIYRGITQKELAASIGLYLEEYQDLECSSVPNEELLERAVTALGLSYSDLKERVDDLAAA